MAFQGPLAGAYAEVDRRSGQRQYVDDCVAVSSYIDLDGNVVDQVSGGVQPECIPEISDFREQTSGIRTANRDVFDRQGAFIGVSEFADVHTGFQLDSHTGLTGDTAHLGVINGFQVGLGHKREACNGQH